MSDGVDGGTLRFNSGKTPYQMIPPHLLEDSARVLHHVTTREHNPYPPFNWARGRSWLETYGCNYRHMADWYRGIDLDHETGLPHLAHMICNLLFLTHYSKAYPEGDDRPKHFFKPESTSGVSLLSQGSLYTNVPCGVHVDGAALEL